MPVEIYGCSDCWFTIIARGGRKGEFHQAVQNRQESYAYVRRKVKFRDSVYLKVSPTKDTIRFRFSGKLKPEYIGPLILLQELEI